MLHLPGWGHETAYFFKDLVTCHTQFYRCLYELHPLRHLSGDCTYSLLISFEQVYSNNQPPDFSKR